MSISISSSPTESPETIKELLKANLFSVFDERHASSRATAIAKIYAEDIVWFEPDVISRGHEAINKKAGELLGQAPQESRFHADGGMNVCQNMGSMKWKFGPSSIPDMVCGEDTIVVEDGKIKIMWTVITKGV